MERTGTVTILFTDIVDSTRNLQRLGDRRWDRVRRAHFASLRESLVEHGGTEVKNTGDGLMAVFTSAVDAVSAGLEMQRACNAEAAEGEVVHIRVGISTGEATVERGDYFGTPVVEAARVCAFGGAGDVLTTSFVRLLARQSEVARFTSLGSQELKGFDEPLEVYRVSELPLANVSMFRAVDQASGGSRRLVTELDYWESLPSIQRVRGDAMNRLNLLAGDVICDIGCGAGSELVRLAQIVGPTGRLIGVEVSTTMLEEAALRATDAGVVVELVEADGRATGLADASVDAVRIERVIQHVGDADALIAEAVRITRPGGRIVVIDTDWGSLVSWPGDRDVLRRLKGVLEFGRLADPWSGRQLHGALQRAGLADVSSGVHAITAEGDVDGALLPMLERVALVGVITRDEFDQHRALSIKAIDDGSFVYAFLMFVASATVPGSDEPD